MGRGGRFSFPQRSTRCRRKTQPLAFKQAWMMLLNQCVFEIYRKLNKKRQINFEFICPPLLLQPVTSIANKEIIFLTGLNKLKLNSQYFGYWVTTQIENKGYWFRLANDWATRKRIWRNSCIQSLSIWKEPRPTSIHNKRVCVCARQYALSRNVNTLNGAPTSDGWGPKERREAQWAISPLRCDR